MSNSSEPVHLSNHHRTTLAKIFQHPVNHNLEWKDVLSLMGAVGVVEERHDGKYSLTLGSVTEILERPKHKDVSAQEILDLRRMLTNAGLAPTSNSTSQILRGIRRKSNDRSSLRKNVVRIISTRPSELAIHRREA